MKPQAVTQSTINVHSGSSGSSAIRVNPISPSGFTVLQNHPGFLSPLSQQRMGTVTTPSNHVSIPARNVVYRIGPTSSANISPCTVRPLSNITRIPMVALTNPNAGGGGVVVGDARPVARKPIAMVKLGHVDGEQPSPRSTITTSSMIDAKLGGRKPIAVVKRPMQFSSKKDPPASAIFTRMRVRPCLICCELTANTHGDTVVCAKCEASFHGILADMKNLRQSCRKRKPFARCRCPGCRLIRSADTSLSKWGSLLTERAKTDWMVLDRTLAELANTTCTTNDMMAVYTQQMNQMYGLTSNTSYSLINSGLSTNTTSPAPKRRVLDASFGADSRSQQHAVPQHPLSVSAYVQVAPRPPPNASAYPEYNVVPDAERGNTAASRPKLAIRPLKAKPMKRVLEKKPALFQSSLQTNGLTSSTIMSDPVGISTTPGSRTRNSTLVKEHRPPIAILPKPSLSNALGTVTTSTVQISPASAISLRPTALAPLNPIEFSKDSKVLARRLSRLIKPGFMQVHTKHYSEVRVEPKLVETTVDNHATLFQLFDFFDWEWNQPIEVSHAVRQGCWSVFHEQLNESLTDMVRFIKRIPGFPILKPQDRILLVRSSGFELAFTVHYLHWNIQFGTWHGAEHFVLTLEQLIAIFPAGELFFRYGFANAGRLAKLTKQLQHMGLFAALVVLNARQPDLCDAHTVEALRGRILEAIESTLNVKPREIAKTMSELEFTMDCLREMGKEHRRLLHSLKEDHYIEFPDDLYAELFELIVD